MSKLHLTFWLLCLTFLASAQTKVVVDEIVTQDEGLDYLYIEAVTIRATDADGVTFSSADQEFFVRYIQPTPSTPVQQRRLPSPQENFVRTETAKYPETDEAIFTSFDYDKKVTTYSYSDGLGRPIIDVVSKGSSTVKDIIAPYYYDENTGLPNKSYLPYAIKAEETGALPADWEAEQDQFYKNTSQIATDVKPFASTVYEPSPLRRVKDQRAPGATWQDASGKVSYKYLVYDGDVADPIQKWYADEAGLQPDGLYGTGELSITEVTSEDGIRSQQLTDGRGLNVANRTWDGTGWNTSYQVYDDFGRLRFLIPPLIAHQSAVTDDELWNLVHQYEYDERGRLKREKPPGAGAKPAPGNPDGTGWTDYIYDQWNNLILSQHPGQEAIDAARFSFYRYDAFNRLIMTGETELNTSDISLIRSEAMSGLYNRYETPNSTALGYTINQAYPAITEAEVYTVQYYDNYNFVSNAGLGAAFNFNNPAGFSNVQETNVLDLPTGSKVRIVGNTTDWLHTVVYYDDDYQVIQSITENHLGGTDRVTQQLSFIGQVEQMEVDHSSTHESLKILTEYEYDDNEFPTRTYMTIGDGTRTMLSDLQYNELDQLIEQNLQSTDDGASFLQSIDYRYNIRGWLESINNTDLSVAGNNDDADDLFGMEYDYTTYQVDGAGAQPGRYDGNIKAIRWNSNNLQDTPQKKQYSFDYDDLNRLTGATFDFVDGNPADNAYNVKITKLDPDDNEVPAYDANGNIQQLDRYAEDPNAKIDELVFSYEYLDQNDVLVPTFNQLNSVVDAADVTEGFKDLSPSVGAGEYGYDENGNLTGDDNKEISAITYNHLQLVESVTFYDGEADAIYCRILYTYDAVGNRLSKELQDGSGNTISKVDYVGIIEYLNNSINFLYTDEGRAYKQQGEFHYEYFITDHQGNNRVGFGYLPGRHEYLATMENDRFAEEQTVFVIDPSVQSSQEAHKGQRSAALNTSQRIGPAKVLQVSAGDIVSMEAFAKYTNGNWGGNPVGVLPELLSALSAQPGGLATEASSALTTAFNSASGPALIGSSGSTTEPAAYLQWIFFDTQYNWEDQAGYDGVDVNAFDVWDKLEISDWVAPEDGFLYVYIANESAAAQNVYFDNLRITHESNVKQLRVTQVNDYYPFGMQMGTSWRDPGYIDPGLLYQSAFADYDENTGTHDFLLRNYDASIGRWWQTDPYDQFASPYLGMGNMPHWGTDPDGGFSWITGAIGAAALGTAAYFASDGDLGFTLAGAATGFVLGGALYNQSIERKPGGGSNDGRWRNVLQIKRNSFLSNINLNLNFSVPSGSISLDPLFALPNWPNGQPWTFEEWSYWSSLRGFNYASYESYPYELDPNPSHGSLKPVYPFYDLLGGGIIRQGAKRIVTKVLKRSVKKKVEKTVAKTAPQQILGKPASSKVLAKNLNSTGVSRPANSAAHHIVAGGDPRASVARNILRKEKIDINDADNGLFLPKNTTFASPPTTTHSVIHTNKYYQTINSRLQNAPNVRQELKQIGKEILNGVFPY